MLIICAMHFFKFFGLLLFFGALNNAWADGATASPNTHHQRTAHHRAHVENPVMIQPDTQESLYDGLSNVEEKVSAQAVQLIENAMSLLGVPYKRAGYSVVSGFDCSGFVRAIFEKTIGLILPHNASEQASVTEKVDPSQLQPGDLVFFNTLRHSFSHVGIYLGDGKFIHSPRSGAKVRVEDMRQAYWVRRFNGARRVPLSEMNAQYFINSIKADLPQNPTSNNQEN